jgi:hypothetical protein
VITVVGDYIVKCVKTGQRIGAFYDVWHGSGTCANCGRHLKWLWLFNDVENPSRQVVLGSECATNVPKFSYAYSHYMRFKQKLDYYLKLAGKKLSELSPEHKLCLMDIEAEIKKIQYEQEQERKKRIEERKAKFASLHQRLCTFTGQSSFLDSIRSQLEDNWNLSEKQIQTAIRVMDEIEPHIEARSQREDKYRKQIERLKQFVWIDSPDWTGGTGWTHEYVRTGRIHRDILLSFCQQLKQGRLLSDNQEKVIEKCEHIYRKQLRLNAINERLAFVSKMTGVAWDGVRDEFYALKKEFQELTGKEYLSPSDAKMPSEGVKP